MTSTTPLEIAFQGRTQVRSLIGLTALPVLVAVGGALGALPTWLAVLGVLVLVGLLVVGIVGARRLGRGRPAARLDTDGITVPGAPLVPWTDLEAVVVGPLRPRWFVGTKSSTIVSFLPRAGVKLPGPPQPSGRPLGWARHVRQRLYGTNLLLATSALSVGADEIAEAARALGGLPVRHERFRGVRDWGVLVLVAVLLGVGIALVRHLLG